MLSAIVLACDALEPQPVPPEAVVASVAALVPAVIAGLVREACLAALAGSAAMRDIADHAGCGLAEAADAEGVLRAALESVPGPHLLVLRAGCVPEHGFVEELADLLRYALDDGALLRQVPAGGLARLFPSLAPAAGIVGSRRAMLASGRRSLEGLVRALRPQRAFRCRAIRIG